MIKTSTIPMHHLRPELVGAGDGFFFVLETDMTLLGAETPCEDT